jgi:hypothetical protein
MKITGPERYRLTFDAKAFAVTCQNGTPKFSGIATSKKPKLYVFASIDEIPIYVGITKQPIRKRLNLGWNAKGETGYYGYAFRHDLTEANLDIWCHEDALVENASSDIETVEAEVVFLIRCSGQWPRYQTEIHFHPSKAIHKDVAASIMQRYQTQLPPQRPVG